MCNLEERGHLHKKPEVFGLSVEPASVKASASVQCHTAVLCSVTQSCPTLWDPNDCSPPGSSVHGLLQARILEWVAMSYSRGSSRPKDWTHVSCICSHQRKINIIPHFIKEETSPVSSNSLSTITKALNSKDRDKPRATMLSQHPLWYSY